MIFDQPPAELPVATLRPRDAGAQLLLDLRGWLAARWRWFRPRAIPVAVAFAGMLGVLASANYLRDLAHRTPERLPPPVITTSHAASGEPVVLTLEPGVYRVRIVEPAPAPAPAAATTAPAPAPAPR